MIDLPFPISEKTTYNQLQNYYSELLEKIDKHSPRTRIIIQAKLITTKIDALEFQTFNPDCQEIYRKIKAVTEASKLINPTG